MKNYYFLFLTILLINGFIPLFASNLKSNSLQEGTVIPIDADIPGDSNHKMAEYNIETTETEKSGYFKYIFSDQISSLITTFRIEFYSFSTEMSNFKVLCANFESTASDKSIIETLQNLKAKDSACINGFVHEDYFDGVVRFDKDKKILAIMLQMEKSDLKFNGRVNLRVVERNLTFDDHNPNDDETYTLVPYSITPISFRVKHISKLLFYSYSRYLQMLYAGSTPYPDSLFSGNILNVYTNENMIRQKYHNAKVMTLVVNPRDSAIKDLKEDFQFEVKQYETNYLLDYFVSSHKEGRVLNKPLLINMTDCSSDYYAILNYNQQEGKRLLLIDQIYGKFESLKIANTFTHSKWDDMISQDMEDIDIEELKHPLPANSSAHIDVFKIKCKIPLMFNFYFIEENESELPTKMGYGDIKLFILKPYESVHIPLFSEVERPQLIFEIYEPHYIPSVIIAAPEEKIYTMNSLIKANPMSLPEGITIKERGGSKNTRIIVKIGYPQSGWEPEKDPNVKYHNYFKVYAFNFPTDQKRYNYSYVTLKTSGTNNDDNVKYCFNVNIGAPLQPSSENCIRVSKDNAYTLKVFNSLNMYKEYNCESDLSLYVTFKNETESEDFKIESNLIEYDTETRNFIGENNKVTLNNNIGSSILTQPLSYFPFTFVQIHVCDKQNSIKYKINNTITNEIVVDEQEIKADSKNNYVVFNNIFSDAEIYLTGKSGTKVFIREQGLSYEHTLKFNENFKVSFDNTSNTINIECPLKGFEYMEYTVFIGKENEISKRGLTLCDFVHYKMDDITKYHKTINSYGYGSVQINFKTAELYEGDKFEAIVYIEQKSFTKMAFLSDVIQDYVGEIALDTVYDINDDCEDDHDYVYKEMRASESNLSFYFTFQPDKLLDVPFGALRIELDEEATGTFTGLYCAFTDNDTDVFGIIEEIENVVESGYNYCLGGQTKTNSKRYNYIFKYMEKNEKPQKLIIKLINGNLASGRFNIYIRKERGVEIERTNFIDQKKYGMDESLKKSIIPYIVDLQKIRGEDSESDKISKILFYSQYSELQMYIIKDEDKLPKKLFFANIALVLTNLSLAIEKYGGKTLVLLSEDPQEDSPIGSFRFHTKMFKSQDQIQFFVSENKEGRTLNYPLSFEMNVCNNETSKLYYILNYNKPEPMRTLHLDMIFGKYKKARIAREINAETWDDLLGKMTEIKNHHAILQEKSQHIDVVEIECASPFLLNTYYSYNSYRYTNLRPGEIVVRELSPNDELFATIDPMEVQIFYYTLSLYNPNETAQFIVRFSGGDEHFYSGNSMSHGQLMYIPQNVTFINNVKTRTRFIFKIGLNVENGEWKDDTPKDVKGKVFVKDNRMVYKFPTGPEERNYSKVRLTVRGANQEPNIKVCYSTNLGVAIEASRENCFRTGLFIPYTLTFINPLIVSKDYETTDNNYYIEFRPYLSSLYISLSIEEETYNDKIRNDEGIARKLVLNNKEASTLLSLPISHTDNILVQIRSCTDSIFPVVYRAYDALSMDLIHNGKTLFKNDTGCGIYFTTDKTWVETELKLFADESETKNVEAFVKHTAIGNNRVVFQEDYTSLSFDESKNIIFIKKPMINETFIISVVADVEGQLGRYTQCDFSFGDIDKIGKYHKTFESVTSNIIQHLIDFESHEMSEGTKFELLVYAKEKYNSKMEFLYPLFTGKVGKITGVDQVNDYIGNEYATLNFKYNLNDNYFYYDFPQSPLGLVASLRILSPPIKVLKVSCVFVPKSASESAMIIAVNNAMLEGNSVCLNLGSENNREFNALIKAKLKDDNSRLVVQTIYGIGEDDFNDSQDLNCTINIKISGTQFGVSTGKHQLDEKIAPIPYVIDLEAIRKKGIGDKYVSKIIFYSKTTKMTMHYISDESSVPLTLFDGNVMLVYTNEDLIYQKYHNAKLMILTTNARNNIQNIIDVQHFDSDTEIQYYYLGSDATGRVLNNPNAIEMTSCDFPYYYIMNYNKVETGKRKLHIDNIFGEVDSIKIATSLEYYTWNEVLDNMYNLDNEQMILPETEYPFDIIEVKCKLPLLLNLYYADPDNIKTKDLEIGDIVILSLPGSSRRVLSFKEEQGGPFVYSFSIFQDYNAKPNIEIYFNDERDIIAKENGLHIKDSWIDFKNVTIVNLDKSSGINTRIIIKMGYVIESTFTRNKDNVYQNIDVEGRTINLYGYKYITTSKRLNYTGVDFEISTLEDNVKFCYSTNLGAYINPSLTNCFRVGKKNPYTIRTRNPLIMYKNYYQEDIKNYYVGFRTVELNQNIIIKPKLLAYDADYRSFENINTKIKIKGDTHSTILTAPSNHDNLISAYISVCTSGEGVSYEFYNAYDNSSLGYNDHISSDPGYGIISLPNTKLDTKLKLMGKEGLEVFIKHVGMNDYIQPEITPITIEYSKEEKTLTWKQPIENEEFRYDIYIDKLNNIRDKGYTLCSLIDTTKLGRFHDNITTAEYTISYTIDFTKPELYNLTDFDAIIIAQQINNGKLIFLSPVYPDNKTPEPEKKSVNVGLIVIIVVLSVVVIGGGIGAYFIIKKYRSKGVIVADGKATSMAMIGSTKNEKLVESQVAVDP